LRRFLALVIALCMAGVTLITRPPFMGFDLRKHISLLGVGFALGQVRGAQSLSLPHPGVSYARGTLNVLSLVIFFWFFPLIPGGAMCWGKDGHRFP
jgi:hypothetical protein